MTVHSGWWSRFQGMTYKCSFHFSIMESRVEWLFRFRLDYFTIKTSYLGMMQCLIIFISILYPCIKHSLYTIVIFRFFDYDGYVETETICHACILNFSKSVFLSTCRYVKSGDQSVVLEAGYWPSYNIPFYEDVFDMMGYSTAVKAHGTEFSYELCPRAKIFRRDQGKACTLSLKSFMYV